MLGAVAFCVKQLVQLRSKQAEIEAAGGFLVAISVDPPEKTRRMLAARSEAGEALGFPVLCDPERAAVKAFGVHDRAHDIALPATLILDRAGRVAWKYVGETVLDRPEEAALLAALRTLSTGAGSPR